MVRETDGQLSRHAEQTKSQLDEQVHRQEVGDGQTERKLAAGQTGGLT